MSNESYKALFAQRNQQILKMHVDGKRKGEIGKAFDLNKSRVHQIIADLTGVKRGRGRPPGSRNEVTQ